ncbi:MAG: hypothetical protein M1829_000216 [Trizodia sp. TS-e1964]|nr:MAG: hypothetical protein M1829_000216 [Trizodia sp. TS-e1964]
MSSNSLPKCVGLRLSDEMTKLLESPYSTPLLKPPSSPDFQAHHPRAKRLALKLLVPDPHDRYISSEEPSSASSDGYLSDTESFLSDTSIKETCIAKCVHKIQPSVASIVSFRSVSKPRLVEISPRTPSKSKTSIISSPSTLPQTPKSMLGVKSTRTSKDSQRSDTSAIPSEYRYAPSISRSLEDDFEEWDRLMAMVSSPLRQEGFTLTNTCTLQPEIQPPRPTRQKTLRARANTILTRNRSISIKRTLQPDTPHQTNTGPRSLWHGLTRSLTVRRPKPKPVLQTSTPVPGAQIPNKSPMLFRHRTLKRRVTEPIAAADVPELPKIRRGFSLRRRNSRRAPSPSSRRIHNREPVRRLSIIPDGKLTRSTYAPIHKNMKI